MDLETTQVFDRIIKKQQKKENPFCLSELEDMFVRRSLPAFLKSAVKYSGDLGYNTIDFRNYLACFKTPYNEERPHDSYIWRMGEFMMGEEAVFTRSCGAREEMITLKKGLLDETHQASGNLDLALTSVSETFATIISDFSRSSTDMKYKLLDGNFVNGLISADRLPETGFNEGQVLYCTEIIRDSMNETQRDKNILTADLINELEGPTA